MRIWLSFRDALRLHIILVRSKAMTWNFFFASRFLQFCKKKKKKIMTNKWPIYDHFWPFFANYMNIFHKTEIQFNWIKSNDMITVKVLFFHAWKCIISGLVCRSDFWHLLRKSALIFSKWLFSLNSFRISWHK